MYTFLHSSLRHSSLTKFRLIARLSSFRVRLNICLRTIGSPTLIEIIASVSYVRLYGIFWIDDLEVQRYARRTSNSFSVHQPFAFPTRFFRLFKMTLLAASTCPLVWDARPRLLWIWCRGHHKRIGVLGRWTVSRCRLLSYYAQSPWMVDQ